MQIHQQELLQQQDHLNGEVQRLCEQLQEATAQLCESEQRQQRQAEEIKELKEIKEILGQMGLNLGMKVEGWQGPNAQREDG